MIYCPEEHIKTRIHNNVVVISNKIIYYKKKYTFTIYCSAKLSKNININRSLFWKPFSRNEYRIIYDNAHAFHRLN